MTSGLQVQCSAKCIGTARRPDMHCGIDCSITVEFVPAIMVGRGDFISASAIAVSMGEQRSESG